ncbi:MAG: hypothetical protein IBJ18_01485 [Phycisphaerales bacterium]|nr:hypothetical protein [Phycisphaerales bacterium]
MTTVFLACGPAFDNLGVGVALPLLLLVKPITYVFFILAFRYRVGTPEPLSRGSAVSIAIARAVVGIGLLYVAWLVMNATDGKADRLYESWAVLLAERALVWAFIGWRILKLDLRRLSGWTLSGVGIDLAFDITVGTSLFFGPAPVMFLLAALTLFLFPLYSIGSRPSLKARFFAENLCTNCRYDLTGLTSQLCPECGAQVPARAVLAHATDESPRPNTPASPR